MKRAAALIGLAALGACATPPPPPPQPVAVATRPPAYTPVMPARPRDSCGADALQGLVGKPRTEIPVPVHPGARRVTCTTCPVTMDYMPGRLNILYDADTGVVAQVKCG